MTRKAETHDFEGKSTQKDATKGVDPRLLEVLICPVTRGPLHYDRKANELVSRSAGLAFPIRNGVPVMLRNEAREISASK